MDSTSEEDEFKNAFEQEYLDESQAVYKERYDNIPPGGKIDRLERGRYAVSTALYKYFVKPHQKLTQSQRRDLVSLIESAQDERAIQSYLTKEKFILTRKIHPAHHAQLCIPKPKLGSQYAPDFLIAGLDSGGLWWYGVELETPKVAMFRKDGDPTSKLSHALRQIEDWRSWLRKNISYAQTTLGFTDIDADLPCYIIIGKRQNEVLDEDTLHDRRREVQKRDKAGLFLHHYEWLLDDHATLIKVK
jgi:hypothetical protein